MEIIVDIFQGLLPLIDAVCNRDEFARLVVLKGLLGSKDSVNSSHEIQSQND